MFNDHQIMCQDSRQALSLLGGVVACAKRRVQPSFVSGDNAVDLPAIAVNSFMESSFHLAAISGLGPSPAGISAVERNGRTAYAQFFATQTMIGLAVVAGVGQQSPQSHVPDRLPHRRSELVVVVAGAANHIGCGDPVALRVANDCHLRPAAAAKTLVSAAIYEVGADVVRFQAGGINGPLWLWGDQAASASPFEDGCKQSLKSPFFISRRSA